MALMNDVEYKGLNWRAYVKIDEIFARFYHKIDGHAYSDVVGELDESKVIIEVVMGFYADREAALADESIFTRRYNVAIPRESKNILEDIYITLKAYSPDFSGAQNA